MRILEINTTLRSGSTGRLSSAIRSYINEKSTKDCVSILYGTPEKADNQSVTIYNWFGSHIHSFFSRKLGMQGRCSQIETFFAIRYIKSFEPDIIHLHNIHGHYLNYVILFKFLKRYKKPVIWTFHDCWPFTGKCAHYAVSNCNKWISGCNNCPNLKTYPDSAFDSSKRDYRIKKRFFNSIDDLTIVCNSNWLLSQVKKSFLKDKNTTVINNGIDINVFKPSNYDYLYEKYNIPKDKKILLGVSSVWKQEKGFGIFLDLARIISDDEIIILVGLKEQQLVNLPQNILGILRTENMSELAALYSLADVFINPSLEETFGMVAVEAMACGTPVIVSNSTACPETVNEFTGRIVSMSSVTELYESVSQILQKGKAYYSEHCINNVYENYSEADMCGKYESLYNEVLTGELKK